MVIVPRQFSQVLNDAMYGLVGVWRTLLVPALVVMVPVSLATIVTFAVTGGADFLDVVLNNPERLQALPDEVFRELAQPFYTAIAIATFLLVAAGVFLALASHSAVAAHIRGEPLTSAEATRIAIRRYLTGFAATILVMVVIGVLIALGSILWLIPAMSVGTPNAASALVALVLLAVVLGPGIWAAVSVSMTTPTVALERRGALGSIRRSMQLVKGRWWPTAGFLLLVGLLGGIAVQLIQLVALPLALVGGGGAVFTIASALGVLGQGLLVAAIAAMYTHWYIDLRARKEDLSTEALG